jgi:hypothetical protein
MRSPRSQSQWRLSDETMLEFLRAERGALGALALRHGLTMRQALRLSHQDTKRAAWLAKRYGVPPYVKKARGAPTRHIRVPVAGCYPVAGERRLIRRMLAGKEA